MASTISTDPTAFGTYNGLANAHRKALADGTFSGTFSQAESDAIADLALGLTEKSSNPISLLLDVYSSPRGGAVAEKSFVHVGDIVGG